MNGIVGFVLIFFFAVPFVDVACVFAASFTVAVFIAVVFAFSMVFFAVAFVFGALAIACVEVEVFILIGAGFFVFFTAVFFTVIFFVLDAAVDPELTEVPPPDPVDPFAI